MTASRQTPKKKTRRAGVRVSSAIRPAGSTAGKRNQPARKTQSVRQPKPKTAYELCERVAQHIEEEPLRYIQTAWWLRGAELRYRINSGMTAPPCGTAACRGGWIVGLHDGFAGAEKMHQGANFYDRAKEILGVDGRQVGMLFNAYAVPGEQGTPEYAAEGAAGLRRWMKRYATRLKARLLKDVPKLRSVGQ